MMAKNLFYTLLLLNGMLISGCSLEQNRMETQKKELTSFLKRKKIENLGMFKNIMIIPSVGCSGCISDAESQLKNNILDGETDILYILTEVHSKKILSLKLTEKVMTSKYIVSDDESELGNSSSFKSIYPTNIKLQKGEIIDIISRLK